MKKRKVNNRSSKTYYFATYALIVLGVMFLSIGFASSSINGTIQDILAEVKPQGDARVTGISYYENENNGSATSLTYNHHSIHGAISLPSDDSTVTLALDVSVLSASEMQISSVTGLGESLEFEFQNFEIGDVICNQNDECNYGITATLYLTIKYKEGEYDANNTNFPLNLSFNFAQVNYVARIGNTRYGTLKTAVANVPTTGVQTTVILLKNTAELVNVVQGQNILFNFQSFTLSNNGVNPIIENDGTITITNGTITTDTSQGAINNTTHGIVNVTGGRIVATGIRQAIYNNGGTVNISGDAYLSAAATQRGVITNLAGSTLNVNGGTIISSAMVGIDNSGTLNIGVKDGTVNSQSPWITGNTYGVKSTVDYVFYDGIIEGKTKAVNDEAYITDIETGYDYLRTTVDGYKRIRLARVVTITFNGNGGTVLESSRQHAAGEAIGELPIPTRVKYEFTGWYTQGGDPVDSSTVINSDITLYAHWEKLADYVAEVNGIQYESLQDAIDHVPSNNTKTVITLLQNITECVTINNGKYIEFNMGSYYIRNDGTNPVIWNKGKLDITNGRIITNATQGAINNETTGILHMSGGSIEATGTKQAIYNNGGFVEISGTAHLSNTASDRAAVHNLNNGTMNILGGTIESSKFNAVENVATINIGTKDGNIDTSSPLMIGKKYGINSTGTLNFYDGVFKGVTNSINGTITEIEDNSTRFDTTEVINNTVYKVTYLQ